MACWVERYGAMSRTAGRRTSRHLESTVEDAAVLFTALLASPVPLLPGAVAAAISNGGGADDDDADQRHRKPTESAAAAAAAAEKTAGLDWLAGIFRLGLACEKAAPGEAASALASAPEATSAALAEFLAAAGATGAGADAGVGAAAAAPATLFTRRVRRAEAGARWLACRLMACGGGGGGTPRPWPALRKDCALQVRVIDAMPRVCFVSWRLFAFLAGRLGLWGPSCLVIHSSTFYCVRASCFAAWGC